MFTSHDAEPKPHKPETRTGPSASERPVFGGSSLIDPVFVAGAVWNSKRLILLCTVLGGLLAVLFALSTPKEYTATSLILADPRDIKVVQNEVTPNGLPSEAALALIESQISVVYSNDVLSKVVRRADLLNDTDFNGKGDSLLGSLMLLVGLDGRSEPSAEGQPMNRTELLTLENLRRAMTVTRDAKSFVLNLSVKAKSPVKAAELANLIAETFIDELAIVQSSTARRASDALSGRLQELRESVVVAERAVEEYKSENRLVGVGGRLVDDDYILRINDQLARSRGEITALRVRAEQMRNATVDAVVKGALPEEMTSETLARLRDNYSDLARQEAILSATLGPRHPQRIANAQALAAARDAIRAEIARIVSATQTELRRAEETDRNLSSQVDELKTKQLETSGSFVKLRELEREVEASRAVYEAFLLRARETGEQESLNTANVRVISAATPPLRPSNLSRRTAVMLGVFGGFLFGVGLAASLAIGQQLSQAIRRSNRDAIRPDTPSGSDTPHPTPIAANLRGPDMDVAAVRRRQANDDHRLSGTDHGTARAEPETVPFDTDRTAETVEPAVTQRSGNAAGETAVAQKAPAPIATQTAHAGEPVASTTRRSLQAELDRVRAAMEAHPALRDALNDDKDAPARPHSIEPADDQDEGVDVDALEDEIASVRARIDALRRSESYA